MEQTPEMLFNEFKIIGEYDVGFMTRDHFIAAWHKRNKHIIKIINEMIEEYTPNEPADTEASYSEAIEALKELKQKIDGLYND